MKDKIDLQLNKYLLYPIYIVSILGMVGFFRGCSATKENTRLRKEVTELKLEVDSLNVDFQNKLNDLYTKEELDIRMEIEGLKTSKRTLYDWNTIVRTTVRPDDRMNEYDKQIKSLEEKLK